MALFDEKWLSLEDKLCWLCAVWYSGTATEPLEPDWCYCATAPPSGKGPDLGPPCWQSGRVWSAETPKKLSGCCDVQPSLVKSCSDYSELSSPDVICVGVLGAAYPPMSSRSMLLSSWWSTLGPGCCWSLPFLPFSEEAVRWTQRLFVGEKGDWLPKQICQLAEVGMAGTECPYQGVLVAVCRTELTFFVLHVTHSYCMTFIE